MTFPSPAHAQRTTRVIKRDALSRWHASIYGVEWDIDRGGWRPVLVPVPGVFRAKAVAEAAAAEAATERDHGLPAPAAPTRRNFKACGERRLCVHVVAAAFEGVPLVERHRVLREACAAANLPPPGVQLCFVAKAVEARRPPEVSTAASVCTADTSTTAGAGLAAEVKQLVAGGASAPWAVAVTAAVTAAVQHSATPTADQLRRRRETALAAATSKTRPKSGPVSKPARRARLSQSLLRRKEPPSSTLDTTLGSVSSVASAASAHGSGAAAAAYAALLRTQKRAAVAIQRLYRWHLSHSMGRKVHRRHRAAVAIQRTWRGYVTRRDLQAAARHLDACAATIQRRMRAVQLMRFARGNRRRAFDAVAVLQAGLRPVCQRLVLQRHHKATAIQRVWRGCCGRRRAAQRRLDLRRAAGATAVQTVWRGYRTRLWATEAVFKPAAAVVIQSACRGWLARRLLASRKAQVVVAAALQRLWRGAMGRDAFGRLWARRRARLAAVRMQAAARMWAARRKLLTLKAIQAYDAAVLIVRFMCRVRVYVRKFRVGKRQQSATAIQSAWRACLRRQGVRVLWRRFLDGLLHRVAVRIQAAWRGWHGRQAATVERLVLYADQLVAVRVLQRWWRSTTARIATEDLRLRWKVRCLRRRLDGWRELIVLLEADGVEVQADLNFMRRRRKKLRTLIKGVVRTVRETRRRIPDVQVQIAKLTVQDWYEGWGAMLDQEAHVLGECLAMGKEDLHARKIQAEDARLDEEAFALELDDVCINLDDAVMMEVSLCDNLRELELEVCRAAMRRDLRNAIRRQRLRWSVKDLRPVVTKREQDAVAERVLDAHGGIDALTGVAMPVVSAAASKVAIEAQAKAVDGIVGDSRSKAMIAVGRQAWLGLGPVRGTSRRHSEAAPIKPLPGLRRRSAAMGELSPRRRHRPPLAALPKNLLTLDAKSHARLAAARRKAVELLARPPPHMLPAVQPARTTGPAVDLGNRVHADVNVLLQHGLKDALQGL